MPALQRYLVPCPPGAAFAVRSSAEEPRRRLLLALLAGAADAPVNFHALAAHAGVGDRRELATLLFQMQRDDWVHCELQPPGLCKVRLPEALPKLLSSLSSDGIAVLASGAGLCVAYAGIERSQSEHVAALAAGEPQALQSSAARDRTPAESIGLLIRKLPLVRGAREFRAVPLHVGMKRFLLALGGEPRLGTRAFIDLVGLLSRRYCPCTL